MAAHSMPMRDPGRRGAGRDGRLHTSAGAGPRARGFTLLEVLVALLLLALAMVALVRSAGQEAQALVHQREATLAQWIAANVIADVRLRRDLPANGQRQGEQRYAERDWRWQLEVIATDDPQVVRVEVRVYPEGSDVATPAATLSGFVGP